MVFQIGAHDPDPPITERRHFAPADDTVHNVLTGVGPMAPEVRRLDGGLFLLRDAQSLRNALDVPCEPGRRTAGEHAPACATPAVRGPAPEALEGRVEP